MPKLQFFTANLLDEDNKIIPERIPKTSYSSKTITAKCETPRNGRFKIRLSSGPIPFDVIIKIFLDGSFLSGRCFLSGDMEPICDYEISNGNPRGAFQFQRQCSKVQLTVHKCFLGSQIPSEPFNRSHLPKSSGSFCPGLPIIGDWSNLPPVILHEEQEPFLSIAWECSRQDPPITSMPF